MAEIYHVERNGKKYAYRSTSVYDPRKKYPVSVSEYIGRVDETTGEIIPKKTKIESTDFEKMKMAKFGGSYTLLELAEKIGLRDDLFSSFGMDGEKLLAAAIAQVLAGGPLSSVEDVADGSMIRELIGISERFKSERMSEFTKKVGDAILNVEELFERRMVRTKDVLSYDITSVSTYSNIRGWGEWGHNRDGERLKQMNIGLVTDKKGIPIMFETYPGSISDVKTLERTIDRITEAGADSCTIVLDRGFGSATNLKYMLDGDMAFVIPGKNATTCVKSLASSLIKAKGDQDLIKIHEGAVYSVLESYVAVVSRKQKCQDIEEESNDTYDLEIVTSDDEKFLLAPEKNRMKAFVCYNEKRGADENTKLQIVLSEIEKKLKAMNPWDAVRNQKRVAGGYSKFIECRIENDELIIERKRNSISFSMNRAGVFVMFSSGVDDWEDMMSCYDCRTYVEQAFDVLKNELDGNRWRTCDPITAKGRLLIKFIALILWCNISAIFRSEKKRVTVTSSLQSLDNIMAVGVGNTWRLSEISKKNKDMLKLLGLEEPKSKYTLKEHDRIPKSFFD
jgi:transposase